MAECPFCQSEIDEHLAINGGTCPSCFGEIPGEDAPTDPGAVVRARQEKEDAKTVKRSRIPAVLAALALFGVVGGAGYIATRPAPEVPVLDFDELDFPEIEIVSAPEDEPEPEPSVAPRPRTPRPSGSDLLDRPEVDLSQVARGERDAIADAGGPRGQGANDPLDDAGGPMGLRSGPTRGGLDIGIAGAGPQRRNIRGERITDLSEIITMIRGTMTSEIPRLNTCYTRALRTNESLRGAWVLEFTVNREGEAQAVTVTAEDATDAAMESCIAGKVDDWFFQPIGQATPVRKTLRFRPG